VHAILQRVRELAVQHANGTLSTSDQSKIQNEVGQLTAELTRIRDSAQFNGIRLFSATTSITVTIQAGANESTDAAGNVSRIGISLASLDFAGVSTTVASVDAVFTTVSNIRGSLGAVQNRLEHAVSNLGVYQENLSAAESRIRDVDMAAEMVNFTKLGILAQSGTSMLAQANQAPQGVLSLLR
jgi:flagellin